MRNRYLFLLLISLTLFQTITAQKGFRIVELNTENFFDCRHDSLKDDIQFLPSSPKRWTWHRYWQKLQHISKELISMSNGQPPDIICLTEVENDSVMTDLTRKALLRRVGYKYVMTHSKDPRGIDVVLLYQTGTFLLFSWNSIPINFRNRDSLATRDILHVCGKVFCGDTLNIFVCHFSSKINGKRKSEKFRCAEARTLKEQIENLYAKVPKAKVIILGDFNETPQEEALFKVLNAQELTKDMDILPHNLYNLAYNYQLNKNIRGTYKYNAKWDMLDQIIVSGNLLNMANPFHTNKQLFHIHASDFLLEPDNTYSGLKPFRTYNGYKYQGGFSDHLPIVLDFTTP